MSAKMIKRYLVLDLDETLISASFAYNIKSGNHQIISK
jgi:hypothetical protein